MLKITTLVRRYLDHRRRIGYSLISYDKRLWSFAAYCDQVAPRQPITISLAVAGRLLRTKLQDATTEIAAPRQKVAESATTVQQLQLDLTHTRTERDRLSTEMNRRFAYLAGQIADHL